MLTVVTNVVDAPVGSVEGGSWIDEIVWEGARRMLAGALEAEIAAYIAAVHADNIVLVMRHVRIHARCRRDGRVCCQPGA